MRGHLDGAMSALTPGQQQVAASIFGYLVTPSDAKIRYTADDLAAYAGCSVAEVADVLAALSRPELRIIRRVPAPAGDPDAQGYEIFHDVLAGAVRRWGLRTRAAHLERRNKRLSAAVAALLAIAVALIAYSAHGGPLDKLELRTLDARFAMRGDHDPDPRIVLVGLDDRTLRSGTQITRAEHARVLDAVAAGRPRAIVEAFEFEEASKPGTRQLKAAVRRARGRVLLATTRIDDEGNTTLFGARTPRRVFEGGATAAYSGFPEDADGVVRRVIAEGHRVDDGGRALGSLPTLAAQAARTRVSIDARDVPALIDLAGDGGSYPHVSYLDVLRGTVTPATFGGRIVVIGDTSTATTSHEGLRTAAGRMSAAEVQANAIATLLAGIPLRDAPGAITIALIVALAVLAALLALRLSTRLALSVCATVGLLLLLAAQIAFDRGLVLAIVPPLLALVAAAVANPIAARAARIGHRSPA